jgi:hypothetical protein
MHGREVPFQPLQDAPRLLGREGLIERGGAVRIEVVQDQHDAFGGRKGLIDQGAHRMGEVDPGALVGDADLAPGQVRGAGQKEVGFAGARVLGVLAGRLARAGRQRRAHVGAQFLAGLVETDQGPRRIGRAGIDGQDVFHRRGEGGIRLGRNYPALDPPRLEAVFLSVWRTVS